MIKCKNFDDAHNILSETSWAVDGLIALCCANDDSLEQLTRNQLIGLLSPISSNLRAVLERVGEDGERFGA